MHLNPPAILDCCRVKLPLNHRITHFLSQYTNLFAYCDIFSYLCGGKLYV